MLAFHTQSFVQPYSDPGLDRLEHCTSDQSSNRVSCYPPVELGVIVQRGWHASSHSALVAATAHATGLHVGFDSPISPWRWWWQSW